MSLIGPDPAPVSEDGNAASPSVSDELLPEHPEINITARSMLGSGSLIEECATSMERNREISILKEKIESELTRSRAERTALEDRVSCLEHQVSSTRFIQIRGAVLARQIIGNLESILIDISGEEACRFDELPHTIRLELISKISPTIQEMQFTGVFRLAQELGNPGAHPDIKNIILEKRQLALDYLLHNRRCLTEATIKGVFQIALEKALK
jgi:hypothetical protein